MDVHDSAPLIGPELAPGRQFLFFHPFTKCSMRIVALALVVASTLTASSCDLPAELQLDAHLDEWVGDPIAARMGETFSLDLHVGTREIVMASATDQTIARVWKHQLLQAWLVWCAKIGVTQIQVAFADDPEGQVQLNCQEPPVINTVVGVWAYVPEFRPVVKVISVDPDVPFVGTKTDPPAVQCWKPGVLRYLEVEIEVVENPTYYLVICLSPFNPRVGDKVDVAAHFQAADGREVQGLAFEPSDLGEQVVILDVFRSASGESATPRLSFADAGNIGLLCKKTGTGLLRVNFRSTDVPASAEFPVTCRAPHDQGGGG
jgi:hypothetical protein